MRNHASRIAVAAAALVLGSGISGAAPAEEPCLPEIRSALERAGVPAAEIRRALVEQDRSERGGLLGYMGWVWLRSCADGHVLVSMQTDCTVLGVNAYGRCRLPGGRGG